jgi:uncharacterized protein
MATDKPSNTEDEYFAREDALKKQKLALEQQKAMAQKQKEELKKLHFMRCPKCGMELQAIKFRGVELGRCFSCGGHWLDAGELEKVAEPEHGKVMGSVLNWFKVK